MSTISKILETRGFTKAADKKAAIKDILHYPVRHGLEIQKVNEVYVGKVHNVVVTVLQGTILFLDNNFSYTGYYMTLPHELPYTFFAHSTITNVSRPEFIPKEAMCQEGTVRFAVMPPETGHQTVTPLLKWYTDLHKHPVVAVHEHKFFALYPFPPLLKPSSDEVTRQLSEVEQLIEIVTSTLTK